jgi:hypothetical protein
MQDVRKIANATDEALLMQNWFKRDSRDVQIAAAPKTGSRYIPLKTCYPLTLVDADWGRRSPATKLADHYFYMGVLWQSLGNVGAGSGCKFPDFPDRVARGLRALLGHEQYTAYVASDECKLSEYSDVARVLPVSIDVIKGMTSTGAVDRLMTLLARCTIINIPELNDMNHYYQRRLAEFQTSEEVLSDRQPRPYPPDPADVLPEFPESLKQKLSCRALVEPLLNLFEYCYSVARVYEVKVHKKIRKAAGSASAGDTPATPLPPPGPKILWAPANAATRSLIVYLDRGLVSRETLLSERIPLPLIPSSSSSSINSSSSSSSLASTASSATAPTASATAKPPKKRIPRDPDAPASATPKPRKRKTPPSEIPVAVLPGDGVDGHGNDLHHHNNTNNDINNRQQSMHVPTLPPPSPSPSLGWGDAGPVVSPAPPHSIAVAAATAAAPAAAAVAATSTPAPASQARVRAAPPQPQASAAPTLALTAKRRKQLESDSREVHTIVNQLVATAAMQRDSLRRWSSQATAAVLTCATVRYHVDKLNGFTADDVANVFARLEDQVVACQSGQTAALEAATARIAEMETQLAAAVRDIRALTAATNAASGDSNTSPRDGDDRSQLTASGRPVQFTLSFANMQQPRAKPSPVSAEVRRQFFDGQ